MLSRRIATAASLVVTAIVVMGVGTSSALAAGEAHPYMSSFGSFSNPNGIAIDEASGDVYVADIGTNTVYKFDASGTPANFNFPAGSNEAAGNALEGADTPAGSFSFPAESGNLAAITVDNACVLHTPTLTGTACTQFDPSAGDLYVMDAGHGVIDKFSSTGAYINQISSVPPSGAPLLGIGVQADGHVRVYLADNPPGRRAMIDVFDSSVENAFITSLFDASSGDINEKGNGIDWESGHGFAVSPAGDMYLLESCGCLEKLGDNHEPLGRVDPGPSSIAAAVDPATGHLYVDEQSSITEWDTGAMNSQVRNPKDNQEDVSSGALISSFGSLQLSAFSGQGGIAVDGRSGDIYVSNPTPTGGQVYVFGSEVPAVTAGAASGLTKEAATLNGTVDPRGVSVTSCQFEYEVVNSSKMTTPVSRYGQHVPCDQGAAQIGEGTGPVPVTAEIAGLAPGRLYDFRVVANNATGTGSSSGRFATEGPGFGINGFDVSFLEEDGSPDTQAGSHPYEMVTSIALNTAAIEREKNADSRYANLPDGNVRDIIADLPAGLVGDPNATAAKCTSAELESKERGTNNCPPGSIIGELEVEFGEDSYTTFSEPLKEPVYNMVPPAGVAAQIGANFIIPLVYIDVGVHGGGDYPLQASSIGIPGVEPVVSTRLTIFGVAGSGEGRKPFLTLPTGCTGPLKSTVRADSYQNPNNYVEAKAETQDSAGQPLALTGCSKLEFPPTITVSPDTTDASTSSGLTVGVHVSQKAAFNPEGLAESALRDTTVTLPEGVALNPAGADGLEACSEGLAGFTGFNEFNSESEPGVKTATFTPEMPQPLLPSANFCPNGSKIGTVKIKTPLLEHELEGSVYLASQDANPFGSLVAMYMIVEDPFSGSIIKLTGEVTLNPQTGQIVTTFKNTPDLPFENLELHFFGGERAPLSTPSRCGTYTTQASFVPWDGNGPVNTSSSFQITSGPNGSPCPGATLPFSPTVNAGATNIQAGAFSPLTVTLNRKDGEQNLKSVEAKLPPGLSGVLAGVELCPEPRANEGLCGENSKVGEATIGVGVGNQPFTVTGGKFYLTGPYNGSGGCTVGEAGCAPFGITFEVPAKAGPFDLANTKNNHPACDCVVVRGKIELNPLTSAITITSDPPGSPDSIPTSIEGIPLEIQHVNATTTRGDFQFNPTNCSKMALTATVQLSEGGSSTISTPFQVTNCAALKFEPKFSVSTSGKTSKAKGASLSAKLTYPSVPQGTDADLAKVKVELPKQLPSRLTTLQKACTDKQFEANPAACPSESKIGYATVHTPLIPVPLVGPVIFVSHGGEAFPSLTMVLQGYGITIDLVGSTFISKAGITSSTFKTVPDQPFSSFELTLPEGKYSALAANGSLCSLTKTVTVKKKVTVRVKGHKKTETRNVKETQPASLAMPTEFVAQNGAEIHQSTPIGVTGCAKSKPAKKAKKARKKGGKKKR